MTVSIPGLILFGIGAAIIIIGGTFPTDRQRRQHPKLNFAAALTGLVTFLIGAVILLLQYLQNYF